MQATSFSRFSLTERLVGRVGENPGNEVEMQVDLRDFEKHKNM